MRVARRSLLAPIDYPLRYHAVAHHHRDVAVGYREVAGTSPPGPRVDPMSMVGGAGAPEPLNPFLRLGQRSHVRHAGRVSHILAAVVVAPTTAATTRMT